MPPITQIQDNSHILGVFSSPQRKIEEGLEYLRIGFEDKNEAILMVTDELTIDEIKNEIIKKWNISPDGLGKLEKNGIVNIKSSSKLYFSTSKMDRNKILKQYSDITNKVIKKGKRVRKQECLSLVLPHRLLPYHSFLQKIFEMKI